MTHLHAKNGPNAKMLVRVTLLYEKSSCLSLIYKLWKCFEMHLIAVPAAMEQGLLYL